MAEGRLACLRLRPLDVRDRDSGEDADDRDDDDQFDERKAGLLFASFHGVSVVGQWISRLVD